MAPFYCCADTLWTKTTWVKNSLIQLLNFQVTVYYWVNSKQEFKVGTSKLPCLLFSLVLHLNNVNLLYSQRNRAEMIGSFILTYLSYIVWESLLWEWYNKKWDKTSYINWQSRQSSTVMSSDELDWNNSSNEIFFPRWFLGCVNLKVKFNQKNYKNKIVQLYLQNFH